MQHPVIYIFHPARRVAVARASARQCVLAPLYFHSVFSAINRGGKKKKESWRSLPTSSTMH